MDEIIHARRQRVEEARSRVPLSRLQDRVESRNDFRDFRSALVASGQSGDQSRIRIIAEMKQASPSRGLIRRDYDPKGLACAYERAGARALSVLTEEQYFRGALEHLQQARAAVRLPVLRKDFIIDEYQVYESVAAGADALLLIVAALSQQELRNLLALASRLKIAALVEAHTAEEVERAVDEGARIVGINNRNLKTLEVDLETSFRLRPMIPSSCLAVAESGIKTGEDLGRLADARFDAALIGERLLVCEDPGAELAALMAQ